MPIEELKADTKQSQNHGDRHLLREAEVRKRSGIGKTKRRTLILAGLFPAPIKLLNEYQLPGRTSYWLASEIDLWVERQIATHRANLAEAASKGLNGWLNQAFKDAGGHRNA
jgi:predicted DNA-binding transcriptional regulator AlpA